MCRMDVSIVLIRHVEWRRESSARVERVLGPWEEDVRPDERGRRNTQGGLETNPERRLNDPLHVLVFILLDENIVKVFIFYEYL